MPSPAIARQISSLAPSDAFARLSRQPGVFWLDSSLPRAADGRYSIMGALPRWTFSAKGDQWEIRSGDPVVQSGTAPLDQLDALLKSNQSSPAPNAPNLPYFGGAVGWLSYDLGRQFEFLDGTSVDDVGAADIWLAWYDAAVVWDHQMNQIWLVGRNGPRSADEAMDELAQALREPVPKTNLSAPPAAIAYSDFNRDTYMARVRAVREGIARGEYYQLNLVQRFTCPVRESPRQTFLRLRDLNPAPFAAFLDAGDFALLSSSPERFIEVSPDGRIRTCPIKGTRSRSANNATDAVLRQELLGSPKERAELLMIVDLMRNDLGRVCTAGSVAVERLHAIESFATVHHLVGEVVGQLRPEITCRDLLRAVHPGGSITGAPKVSAMRAIDRLEPHRRGIGMGAIGYFSAHGRIELSIAIRTIVVDRARAYVAVGAGIVWDSDPAAEYAETLVKARALFAALGVSPADS